MNEQVIDGVPSSQVKAHTEKPVCGKYRQEREAETDGELLFINMKTYASIGSEMNVNKSTVKLK